MRYITYIILTVILFTACNSESGGSKRKETSKDLTKYYTNDSLPGKDFTSYYVPVYSEIYSTTDKSSIQLTVTLSIRNTSTSESLYVSKVNYYNSHGQKLRSYLKQPVKLKPLQTLDFVVEERDTEGGSGPSFVVESLHTNAIPLIQAVMIGTLNQQGISYLTQGIPVK